MLVISRALYEEVFLFDTNSRTLVASICFCGMRSGRSKVRIGFSAPSSIKILRAELCRVTRSGDYRLIFEPRDGTWFCVDVAGKCLWSETNEETARVRFSLEKDRCDV